MSAFLWLVISAVLIIVAVGSILSVIMCINGGESIKYDSLNMFADDDEDESKKEEKVAAKDGEKPADSEAAGDK